MPEAEIARIRAYFAPPAFETLPARSDAFDRASLKDRAFARWARNNLKPHKQPGYGVAVISLKSVGGVPRAAVSATAPMLRIVPDVPMTRSNPMTSICSQ